MVMHCFLFLSSLAILYLHTICVLYSRKDLHNRRLKKWSYSLHELLQDPTGREQFEKFLAREFSKENLK